MAAARHAGLSARTAADVGRAEGLRLTDQGQLLLDVGELPHLEKAIRLVNELNLIKRSQSQAGLGDAKSGERVQQESRGRRGKPERNTFEWMGVNLVLEDVAPLVSKVTFVVQSNIDVFRNYSKRHKIRISEFKLIIEGRHKSIAGRQRFQCLQIEEGHVYVKRVSFINAGAKHVEGGALWIGDKARICFKKCSFEECKAKKGGAIYVAQGGSVEDLNDCLFLKCSSDWGGAVYNEGFFAVRGSTIATCTASRFGGGIFLADGSAARLSEIEFRNCAAERLGAAVYAEKQAMSDLHELSFIGSVVHHAEISDCLSGSFWQEEATEEERKSPAASVLALNDMPHANLATAAKSGMS